MILVKWDSTWSCWSLSITHFFGVQSIYVWFIIAQMSRRDSKGSTYARLWTLFQVGQFTERRSENFATKLHLKRLSKLFAIFCPKNPWTGHAITSPTQYDHCSRFVNQTRACDQLSRQAHSFPKAHEMFRNHELGQPFSQCQKQVLWLNCDFSLDTSCIRAISSNKLHSPASWFLNWFIAPSYYKVI